jgi:Bacteriophage clamp loader A subunit
MTPFQFVEILTEHKVPWKNLSLEDQKSFNLFMVNKNLSMMSNNIEVINHTQRYPKLPVEQTYNVYLGLTDRKIGYPKYIKKISDNTNKELLKIFADYYETSQSEIKEYIKEMSPKELGSILSRMGYLEKEIKKLTIIWKKI